MHPSPVRCLSKCFENMKALIISVFSVLVFARCEPFPEDRLVRHFVINEGNHYSSPRFVETLQSDRLVFEATFDQTAVYSFDTDGFQDSKNKLLGFSDCNSQHHENSARFGWQWYNDHLEIFAYCYVNGSRVEQFMGTAELNETGRYEIAIRDDEYVFRFDDNPPVMIQRGAVCDKGMYYMLWPYFGGQLPAPHDVHVAISIIH